MVSQACLSAERKLSCSSSSSGSDTVSPSPSDQESALGGAASAHFWAFWSAVAWIPHGWPYINPVQDVEAAKAAVRSGFKTRAAVVSESGDDAEVIDTEQATDNARADGLGLRYDSDGRQPAAGPKNAPPEDGGQPVIVNIAAQPPGPVHKSVTMIRDGRVVAHGQSIETPTPAPAG